LFRAVSLAAVLFATWLLLSGYFTGLLITLGVISCLGVVLIAARMDVIDHESLPIHVGWQYLLYLPWLIWQIVLSNIDIARRIITPSLPISPEVRRIPCGQQTDLGRVIFANSITLTPGTVSLQVLDDEILVHALTEQSLADLEEGTMNRKVCGLEGKP
jgi:multicomponent Na+:H+ antiporter subunit E